MKKYIIFLLFNVYALHAGNVASADYIRALSTMKKMAINKEDSYYKRDVCITKGNLNPKDYSYYRNLYDYFLYCEEYTQDPSMEKYQIYSRISFEENNNKAFLNCIKSCKYSFINMNVFYKLYSSLVKKKYTVNECDSIYKKILRDREISIPDQWLKNYPSYKK